MGYRVDKISDNKNAMCKEYQGSNMFSKPTGLREPHFDKRTWLHGSSDIIRRPWSGGSPGGRAEGLLLHFLLTLGIFTGI